MHYYTFHIGDFRKKAYHLNPLERAAYRELIDCYYMTEKPLVLSIKNLGRLIRMPDNLDIIEQVLKEFFVKENDGWKHARIESDIAKYHDKSAKATLSAMARWDKKPKTKSLKKNKKDDKSMRTHSERNANGMLTNNQEPLTNNKKTILPSEGMAKKNPVPSANKKIDFDNLPASISIDTAKEWLNYRKLQKKPASQRSFDRAMKSAAEAGARNDINLTAEQAVEKCIDAGWAGIEVEWLKTRMEKKTYGKQEVIDVYDWGDGKSLRPR